MCDAVQCGARSAVRSAARTVSEAQLLELRKLLDDVGSPSSKSAACSWAQVRETSPEELRKVLAHADMAVAGMAGMAGTAGTAGARAHSGRESILQDGAPATQWQQCRSEHLPRSCMKRQTEMSALPRPEVVQVTVGARRVR